MKEYEIYPIDLAPSVSEYYQDIDEEYNISHLDTSYFGQEIVKNGVATTRCPLLAAVWDTLVANFNLYYATREIGGETELEFFNMLQSCLNRNADTYEVQLEFYYEETNKPVIGRTETIEYNINDNRKQDSSSINNYGREVTDEESGSDTFHHVEVPADTPSFDTDRTRDKTDYGRKNTNTEGGSDSNVVSVDDENKRTGTQKTIISSLGIKPNVEYMNEYLETNKTFIQFFIESFEECFSPRYRRVYF